MVTKELASLLAYKTQKYLCLAKKEKKKCLITISRFIIVQKILATHLVLFAEDDSKVSIAIRNFIKAK